MVKLELLNVQLKEKSGQLRVIVESVYGIDNLGLSLNKKYLDPDTDKPRWMGSAKNLLEKRYNKEVNIDELERLLTEKGDIIVDVNNN